MAAVQINKGKLSSFGQNNGVIDRTTGTVEELDGNGNSFNPQVIYEFVEERELPMPIAVATLINYIRITTPSIVKIATSIRKGHVE